jgi:hypothetical protein
MFEIKRILFCLVVCLSNVKPQQMHVSLLFQLRVSRVLGWLVCSFVLLDNITIKKKVAR